jgi:hypothetical protein
MKYRKPVPVRQAAPPRRFVDMRRLSPQMVVLYYFVIGMLIAVTLFGGSIFLWNRVAAWRDADVRDMPTQYGTATVETKRYWYSRYHPNRIRAEIGFRIRGHLALTYTADSARYTAIHVGNHVDVEFRVGRSGDIYIDDWQAPRR